MLDFLGKRFQKTLDKMRAKTTLNEVDILEITSEIRLALLEADVNLLIVRDFIKSIKEKAIGSEIIGKLNPSQQMIKIVHDELTKILGQNSQSITIKSKPAIIMVVGLQGSGKTTTAAKVVKYLQSQKLVQKPLMVAADIYRPAAIEQLMTLGKQIGVPVYHQAKSKPEAIVQEALKIAQQESYDLVVIDTAGRLSINEELMLELENLQKIAQPQEILFVADALSGQDIINVATEFNAKLSLTGFIITKLDSDARGGAALSLTKMLNLPIVFIGTGEKVNNLDLFHPNRMADRILGMGDVMTLVEKAQEVLDEDKSKRMMHRMATGKFDLEDLLDQLRRIKKMGKMSKILQMIPNMAHKISSQQVETAEKKLRLFEILINSMTYREKKDPKLLKNNDRKQRIIKGSGRNSQEYNMLVNEFDRVSKQMKEVSKLIKSGKFNMNKFGMR